jgi:hypothetical protein
MFVLFSDSISNVIVIEFRTEMDLTAKGNQGSEKIMSWSMERRTSSHVFLILDGYLSITPIS